MKVRIDELGWWIKDSKNRKIKVPRNGKWEFNGNVDNPTFKPSINETWGGCLAGDGETFVQFQRNHFIITDGKIFYCEDSTHEDAGQTLDLLPLTPAEEAFELAKKQYKE